MDMKLNGQRVKSLRLQKSWSQEVLAEKSGLNQRTIQRVETEGSASLRTRHALAAALEVAPPALDATPVSHRDTSVEENSLTSEFSPVARLRHYVESQNSYQFILLLLLTVFYLAFHPFYFSFSRTSFSWINFMLGRPLVEVPLWWTSIFLSWFLFALPWLVIVRKTRPQYLYWHATAMGAVLLLAIARLWQPALIMETITFGLYYSCLALLLMQFTPARSDRLVRQAVIMLLGSYLFLWFVLSMSHVVLLVAGEAFLLGLDIPPMSYFGRRTLDNLSHLYQLLPVIMVLVFSMESGSTGARGSQSCNRPGQRPETGDDERNAGENVFLNGLDLVRQRFFAVR